MVFHCGNLLTLYTEEPCELAKPYKGLLSTKNSPRHEDWGNLMNTHFDPDFGGWKSIKRI